MAKCLLHIGFPKTGSTSIQVFLHGNATALAKSGFHYPAEDCPRNEASPFVVGGRHFAIPSCLMASHFGIVPISKRIPAEPMLQSLRAYIEQTDGTVILSDEHFALVPKAGVRQLAGCLEGIDTKIIVYVRRIEDYAASLYSTHVLCGERDTFDDFIRGWDGPGFLSVIELWKSLFPRAEVDVALADRKCLKSGDVVEDFCARCGIPFGPEMVKTEPLNVTPSALQVAMIRICNTYLNTVRDAHGNHSQLLAEDSLRSNLLKYLPKRGIVRECLSSAQKSDLRSRFREEEERIASEYLNEQERAVLLSDGDNDASGTPEEWPQPSLEDFASALISLGRDNEDLKQRGIAESAPHCGGEKLTGACIRIGAPGLRKPLLSSTDLEMLFEELPQDIYAVPGQLSFYDRLVYYWAGKQFFSDVGVIIDAGALVGGTALLLAHGLANNDRITRREKRILSFDLFQDTADGFMATAIAKYGGLPTPLVKDGLLDFEPLFRHTIARYAEMIETRRGDISGIGYSDAEPIEILSIDVGKTPDLMRSVAINFFPRLIPGRSIVLNQDYVFPFQPWVAMAMEMLGEFFVLEFEPPTDCTTVHRLVRPISRQEVEVRLPKDYYNLSNIYTLTTATARAASASVKMTLRAAQVHAFWQLGRHRTAQFVAGQMLDEFNVVAGSGAMRSKLTRLFEQIGLKHLLTSI